MAHSWRDAAAAVVAAVETGATLEGRLARVPVLAEMPAAGVPIKRIESPQRRKVTTVASTTDGHPLLHDGPTCNCHTSILRARKNIQSNRHEILIEPRSSSYSKVISQSNTTTLQWSTRCKPPSLSAIGSFSPAKIAVRVAVEAGIPGPAAE